MLPELQLPELQLPEPQLPEPQLPEPQLPEPQLPELRPPGSGRQLDIGSREGDSLNDVCQNACCRSKYTPDCE